MKRWAFLTALIYALALLLLTVPVMDLAFANWGKDSSNMSLKDFLQVLARKFHT